MDFLNDPELREILIDFCDESQELFKQLDDILYELENEPTNSDNLENYGQIIDRVMGAAKSVGAEEIGVFCELAKLISYKASQVVDGALLDVVVAILYDTIDLLKRMVEQLKSGDNSGLENLNTKAFVSRLHWLSDKFKSVERGSVAIEKEEEDKSKNVSQGEIDDLLKNLGL